MTSAGHAAMVEAMCAGLQELPMTTLQGIKHPGIDTPQGAAQRRPRLVTELSSLPFAIPEDEYDHDRPPLQPIRHPLAPEIVPPPPETFWQRLARRLTWPLIGGIAIALGLAAVGAYLLVGMLAGLEVANSGAAAPSRITGAAASVGDAAKLQPPPMRKDIGLDFDALTKRPAAPAEPRTETDAVLDRLMQWEKTTATP
jgi:hypothetical protein